MQSQTPHRDAASDDPRDQEPTPPRSSSRGQPAEYHTRRRRKSVERNFAEESKQESSPEGRRVRFDLTPQIINPAPERQRTPYPALTAELPPVDSKCSECDFQEWLLREKAARRERRRQEDLVRVYRSRTSYPRR